MPFSFFYDFEHTERKIYDIMIIRKEIDFNQPLTPEQKQMLEALKDRPVQPDEDCPELTDEQLHQMVRASKRKNENK